MMCRNLSPLPEELPCCEDSLPVRDRSAGVSSLRQLGSLKKKKQNKVNISCNNIYALNIINTTKAIQITWHIEV